MNCNNVHLRQNGSKIGDDRSSRSADNVWVDVRINSIKIHIESPRPRGNPTAGSAKADDQKRFSFKAGGRRLLPKVELTFPSGPVVAKSLFGKR